MCRQWTATKEAPTSSTSPSQTHIDNIDVQDALCWRHEGKVDDMGQGPHGPVGQQGGLQLGLDCRRHLLTRPAPAHTQGHRLTRVMRGWGTTADRRPHLLTILMHTDCTTTRTTPPHQNSSHCRDASNLAPKDWQSYMASGHETAAWLCPPGASPAALQVAHGCKEAAGHEWGHAYLVQRNLAEHSQGAGGVHGEHILQGHNSQQASRHMGQRKERRSAQCRRQLTHRFCCATYSAKAQHGSATVPNSLQRNACCACPGRHNNLHNPSHSTLLPTLLPTYLVQ